jgi:hypothetical protein
MVLAAKLAIQASEVRAGGEQQCDLAVKFEDAAAAIEKTRQHRAAYAFHRFVNDDQECSAG